MSITDGIFHNTSLILWMYILHAGIYLSWEYPQLYFLFVSTKIMNIKMFCSSIDLTNHKITVVYCCAMLNQTDMLKGKLFSVWLLSFSNTFVFNDWIVKIVLCFTLFQHLKKNIYRKTNVCSFEQKILSFKNILLFHRSHPIGEWISVTFCLPYLYGIYYFWFLFYFLIEEKQLVSATKTGQNCYKFLDPESYFDFVVVLLMFLANLPMSRWLIKIWRVRVDVRFVSTILSILTIISCVMFWGFFHFKRGCSSIFSVCNF